MADEQYEWLDEDAAERLLRGEPVDPVGGQSCTDAERLVAALDAAARAARPAAGELPGEAAALAAFRTATRSARTGTRAKAQLRGAAEKADGPADAEVLEPVRIGAASGGSVPYASVPSAVSGRARPSRWSRPVRFGLVASLAGCALGGVAVAAGTGMFPGPFGGHAPLPATSVSAAATPEELGSGITEEQTPQPPSSASPRTGAATPPADPSPPAGDPDPGRSGGAKENEGGDDRKPGSAATGSPGTTQDGTRPGSSGNDGSGEWYAKALKACREYRDGSLDEKRRRKLEALAKGARNLDRFCDRVIEGSENGQSDQGDDDGQSDDGSNWSSGSGSDSGRSSSARFADGVRLPSTPVSLTPSARTSG
ncbi:hypothetical protein OG978_25110 [Streptomyces sp. NBC_01591]|uniref:hypothetical protein n=1 Tax=Streptomyces sp. NBC_01591 TaxID=2975888 RepID=UPI002DDAEF9B|nr:hypothetical protein [Streptomyces sp. NBC_01591]WSD70368.1 hypothetical protein OG978_25110 [Streptomyces sp. NBC_01591]